MLREFATRFPVRLNPPLHVSNPEIVAVDSVVAPALLKVPELVNAGLVHIILGAFIFTASPPLIVT